MNKKLRRFLIPEITQRISMIQTEKSDTKNEKCSKLLHIGMVIGGHTLDYIHSVLTEPHKTETLQFLKFVF